MQFETIKETQYFIINQMFQTNINDRFLESKFIIK